VAPAGPKTRTGRAFIGRPVRWVEPEKSGIRSNAVHSLSVGAVAKALFAGVLS
jgi:hypothetical protein